VVAVSLVRFSKGVETKTLKRFLRLVFLFLYLHEHPLI